MNWPNPISESDLKILVQRLRAGDESAKDGIIQGHLRLAVSIAHKWLSLYPGHAREILSDAIYGVVDAVDRAGKTLYDNNVTAYITEGIKSKIRNGLPKRFLVRIPRKALIYGTTFHSPTKFKASATYSSVHELREEIYSCAANELEAHILYLKESGYTLDEIQSITGMSVTSVQRVLTNINVRFQNRELRNGTA